VDRVQTLARSADPRAGRLPAGLLNAAVVMIGRVANVVDAAIEDAAGPG